MKIALVGPTYPYRGGIAHFLETMYRGLGARGHETFAVTFTRQYPELLFPGKTQYETAEVEDPVPARRLLDTVNPLTWIRTARHLAKLKPDVVLFKFWMPFFGPSFGTVARYLRRKGIKSVVVVDNAIPHEPRPGDTLLSRYFLKACHGYLVMSDAVENDLATLGIRERIARVPHPVYDIFGPSMSREEARRGLGLPDDSPVLLFFGFIRRYKGLHVLLDSMPRVIERIPNVRLVVAGEFYEDDAPYREIVRQHRLEENVRFDADYIPNDRVAQYFSAADVVVQPYVSATQSGVAQIAYQFDQPLIVTDVGGLAEVVPDGRAGFVVPPENPEALADAIIRFFEEDLRDRFREGVREEKKKYSWDRLYDALEELVAK